MAGVEDGRQLVVAGIDGSAHSAAVLHWAARYAAATGSALRAILAWHYPTVAGQPPEGLAPPAIREQTERLMRESLDGVVSEVFPDGPPAGVEATISYGHPAQVLIEESRHADLLVVGSSGHGAFTGMLVGSVSIHCVTSAFCPVTVVRGAEAESPSQD